MGEEEGNCQVDSRSSLHTQSMEPSPQPPRSHLKLPIVSTPSWSCPCGAMEHCPGGSAPGLRERGLVVLPRGGCVPLGMEQKNQ